jgi:CheY-like chemotaxis protein/DNA-directed RNA polymerase specialized sigma24 family protein
MKIAEQVGPLLPALRRYARALSGSQGSGDTYVRIMLETLITEPREWNTALAPKLAAFQLFHRVWGAVGQDFPSAAPDSEGKFRVADDRLAALAPRSRQALLLTAMEGFSVVEAASILDVDTDEVKMLLEAADADINKATKAKILLIEDEAIIALDIASLVEELGHQVTSVSTTRAEAVAAADSESPDLVLADIQLADGSSGIDAAADILAKIQVPVVFITAFPERLLTGRRVEPTFLITKPFQPDAVRAAISQALFFKKNAKRIA